VNPRPKLALSGSGGFLGWHTRCAAAATGRDTVPVALGERYDRDAAARALDGASRLVHLAGVNRGSDDEVADGNVLFATQLAEAIAAAPAAPPVIVFANSTQAGNASVYGAAKARAAEILEAASRERGLRFVDVLLPNIFGEHGRPFYNSVVATFCEMIVRGESPRIEQDRELTLLHAQDAADLLLGDIDHTEGLTRTATVSQLRDRLTQIAREYEAADVPDLSTPFGRDLFNTYRSFGFAATPKQGLVRHADPRGSFFEVVRAHGGAGQTSFSTTVPQISRGDHFHRRKVERFVVLSGSATISLRRMFHDEVIDVTVAGETPVAVDMPTMWSHRITNTGDEDLFTAFWTDQIFDPQNPDTHAEAVIR
jgi:UDP-2-acetamido-2,6-beta-L-arabino-hexul-4-ose reductase